MITQTDLQTKTDKIYYDRYANQLLQVVTHLEWVGK